jgi:excinuclease ABC subunit B
VLMYADTVTDSMKRAISETNRRRKIQIEYNREHGIDPQTIRKKVSDILLALQGDPRRSALTPEPSRRRRQRSDIELMPREELERLIQTLEEEMHEAAKDLRFEYAARLRDEVVELRKELKSLKEAGVR